MAVPQNGVLALGTSTHAYLEFDRRDGTEDTALVHAVAALVGSVKTTGAVSLVVGVRPELWAAARPHDAPETLRGFDEAVTGPDGFSMPATQHDVVVWVSGGDRSGVFDQAWGVVDELKTVVDLVDETTGWAHDQDRDLTGFEDGTANPHAAKAPGVVLVPDGEPGAGGSVLLLQKWSHDAAAWAALSVAEQENVFGRSKAESIEQEDKIPSAHSERTDQDTYGHIFRRNTAYGDVREHGTMFVGFCATQGPLATMLDAMVGHDGPRDALTRYTTPLTGAYYFVPPADVLVAIAPEAAESD